MIGKKDLSHAPGIFIPQDSHLPNSNGTPRNGIDIGGCDMGNKPKIEDMEMNLMSMEDGKMGMVTDSVGIKIRKMVRWKVWVISDGMGGGGGRLVSVKGAEGGVNEEKRYGRHDDRDLAKI